MMVNGQLVEKAVEKMGLVSDYYTWQLNSNVLFPNLSIYPFFMIITFIF